MSLAIFWIARPEPPSAVMLYFTAATPLGRQVSRRETCKGLPAGRADQERRRGTAPSGRLRSPG